MPNSDNRNLTEPESKPNSIRTAPVLTGAEVHGGSSVPRYERPEALVSIIVQTVSALIAGIRMRLKIKRDLGRKATEADLASINTWIKVEEAEQQTKRNTPLKPE